MLVALGGLLNGYDGSFPFDKGGEAYPDTVPYEGMRQVSRKTSEHTILHTHARTPTHVC